MEYGTVKFFSKVRGFGFVVADAGDDVFVHYTDIISGEPGQRNLATGQRVQFTRKTHFTNKKPCAAKVEIVAECPATFAPVDSHGGDE
jgi:cold shock CspA family protein